MVVIKTKRFILRPYRKGDEKSLQKNINDRHIYKYTVRIPYPYKLKDAKGMRNFIAHQYGQINDKLVYEAITEKLEKGVREFIECIEKNIRIIE